MVDLSSVELVRRVRGERTQIEFAEALGVAQSMVSDWEREAHVASTDVWLKMARLTDDEQLKRLCWERAGLQPREVSLLLETWANPGSSTPDELNAKLDLMTLSSFPEPVTGPPPEQDKAKTLDDLVKRYGPLPELDIEGAKARVREMLDEWVRGGKLSPATREEWVREWGLPPGELVAGEPKPLAPAKKAKRERPRKK